MQKENTPNKGITDNTREDRVIPKHIKILIQDKALFVLNHSGGKDSQAMFLYLKNKIPKTQIFVIHADLPGADWPGTIEHICSTTRGYACQTVKARKTFFGMVKHRQMWPSPKNRQCTSDLKRGPIEKGIRRFMKDNGFTKFIVNCVGKRAEESPARAKEQTFKFIKRNSRAGRVWYDWLPIHTWTTSQVFRKIESAGEQPHWAYKKGMSRLSCVFCIMSSKQDLRTASQLQPDLFEAYCKLERQINHTIVMPTVKQGRQFLPDIISN